MGSRYLFFRVKHAVLVKTGAFSRAFPIVGISVALPKLEVWRASAQPFFFSCREQVQLPKNPTTVLKELASAIFNGDISFFSSHSIHLGKEYDWLTHPITGNRYDIRQHWTSIDDFSETAGDIKYVWEKSRFSYLLTIVRYDHHFEIDCSEWVFNEIEHWIACNPLNLGPNYKCSQEISLRVFHWIFCLYYYRNADALTEERFEKILTSIYGQLHHVRANIDFSRIAVRNNHAITETLALYVVGMLFPFFPESSEWRKKGLKWLEEEVAFQIYEDGTFLQFSHNYHRVTVQLLTWAIHLSRANGLCYSPQFYLKAQQSVAYLFQCQDEQTGALPNYGANDGALFFQLSDAPYRDYRPQLHALFQALTGFDLYTTEYGEDAAWYLNYKSDVPFPLFFTPTRTQMACYPQGGIYVVRDLDKTLTFIKCAQYKDRPSQADNLHLDLWYNGENVLTDAGTYLYNTTEADIRYFFGTEGHNTVMLGEMDQMQKGPRFIWWDWIKKASGCLEETEDAYIFTGSFVGFERNGTRVVHTRKIRKVKGQPIWQVHDHVSSNHGLPMRQIWHFLPTIKANVQLQSTADKVTKNGYHAAYYGTKVLNQQVEFQVKLTDITTEIRIQS
jgi:hypothetical protein